MSIDKFIIYMYRLFVVTIFVLQLGTLVFTQTNRQLERPQINTGQSQKRIALVIGNGNYRNVGALANPVNDAVDMTAALKELGFDVISGTNQTKAQMQNLIRQFGNRLAETKAVGLVFYAGHGIAQNGSNYLIPVDADIQAEDEIEESAVSINFILSKMDSANNGFNMVILDACRNNPFARKWRNYRDIGDKAGLARIDAPTGTLIAYATKPGDVAADGSGRNGLYTGALLKQLRIKNLDITKMFQRVRADVIALSAGKQVPFDESSIVGDFYFAGIDKSILVNQEVSRNNVDTETQYWNNIKNSQEPDDFKNYLKQYPNGQYVPLANQKISSIEATDNEGLTAKHHINRGIKYFEAKDFSRALAESDKAISLSPDLAIGYFSKGHILLMGIKDYKSAVAVLSKAISLDPKYALAYGYRALAYYNLKYYDASITDNSTAIMLNPKVAGFYFFRAQAYEAKGEKDRAAADRLMAENLEKQRQK